MRHLSRFAAPLGNRIAELQLTVLWKRTIRTTRPIHRTIVCSRAILLLGGLVAASILTACASPTPTTEIPSDTTLTEAIQPDNTICDADRLFYKRIPHSESASEGISIACIDGSEVLFTESVFDGELSSFAVSSQGTMLIDNRDGLLRQSYPSQLTEPLSTHSESHTLSYSWSPDGEFVSYVRMEENRENIRLEAMHVESQVVSEIISPDNLEDIPIYLRAGTAEWSPDGSKIAMLFYMDGPTAYLRIASVTCNGATYRCQSDRLDKVSITDPPYEYLAIPFTWSPDSNALLIGCVPYQTEFPQATDLCAIDLSGQLLWHLGDDVLGLINIWGLAWSPDGTRVAITGASREDNEQTAEYKLLVLSLDDNSLIEIISTREFNVGIPLWQPLP